MDTPDRPRAGAAAGFEDSPVFNFINNLSPIPAPKPSDTTHNVQLFKSSDLAPVSSIFASPHVQPTKEPKLLIRDDSVQLPQESHSPNSVRTRTGTSSSFRFIRCRDIVSENHTITCNLNEACIESSGNTTNSISELHQSTQNSNGSVETDKNQCADRETDLNISQECQDLEAIILDQSDPDKMDSSHSGKDVHENHLSEQNEDEHPTYNDDYMITHEPNGDMLTLAVPFVAKTQSANDNANSCKSVPNENSGGYYIQASAHEPHNYWAGPVEGMAGGKSTPEMLPDALQSHLMPNDQACNKFNEPTDYMPTEKNALPQHLRGMRRRSLFNEKAGTTSKGVNKTSDRHVASAITPKCKTNSSNNLKPLRTPPCALPGIGLHLNALAAMPKEKLTPQDTQLTLNQCSNLPCHVGFSPPPYEQSIINDDFVQTTNTASTEDSSQGSPKKKRHKVDNGDGTSCKKCSCKKSKCLKLYCECFAAGVYCSEPCSCQGCLNNHINMDKVLITRQQIESRNPLAFAPKVVRTSEPDQELGDYPNKTPASARHKRGCNCKKSSCTKKYCECFQAGVGCSMSCRCEGCKNTFGQREGVAVSSIEESKLALEEKNACVKEEKCENDTQLVICQATGSDPAENGLSAPMIVDCRPLAALPPSSSKKKPRSSTKLIGQSSRFCNVQAPWKSDNMLSPLHNYAEVVFRDSTLDTLKEVDSQVHPFFPFSWW
ncbi:hypothetical protein QOZ80_5AG0397210 [Eleusine coracana subsp. coracana]|nr:hypothetical protein QOZ80_5AG0397210 [Eleusine coracana subsp. coracana]